MILGADLIEVDTYTKLWQGVLSCKYKDAFIKITIHTSDMQIQFLVENPLPQCSTMFEANVCVEVYDVVLSSSDVEACFKLQLEMGPNVDAGCASIHIPRVKGRKIEQCLEA